jgi:hypothetical protein
MTVMGSNPWVTPGTTVAQQVTASRRTPAVARVPMLAFVLLLFVFAALRLWNIGTYSLWGGEAFTMIGVAHDWRGLISYVVADIVHPPLFYVLLKIWIALGGDSLLWLKLFPVLFGIALVVPFLLLSRELGLGRRETSLALLLVAVNGYLIHYAQELRMYSLFTFLALCSFWLFLRFVRSADRSRRDLLWLTAVNLLLIYTHYYGWLAVGLEFLSLLIWQRGKILAFGTSIVFLLVCFSPWAYLVVQEARAVGGLAQNLDWIPRPRVIDVLRFYAALNGPLGSRHVMLVGLVLFGLPLLDWAWRRARAGFKAQSDETIALSWLALMAFVPVLSLFLISQRSAQALWIDRYFVFAAIPYMMLVATAGYRLEPKWVRNTWMVLVVCWSVLAGLNDLRTNRMAWEGAQMGSRADWSGLARRLVEAEPDPAGPVTVYALPILTRGGLRTGDYAISTSIGYHVASLNDDRFRFGYARDLFALLDGLEDDHFWVAFIEMAPAGQPGPAATLARHDFRVGDEIAFRHMDNRIVLLPVWRR